jgi:hypothetical protein
LEFRGKANAYDVDPDLMDPMLLLSDQSDRNRLTPMSEMLTAAPDWFADKAPRWSVWWSSVRLANVAPNRFRPADFQQHGTGYSGFDQESLPKLPDELAFGEEVDTPGGGSSS